MLLILRFSLPFWLFFLVILSSLILQIGFKSSFILFSIPSSPLKVKEDDEVDNLDIELDMTKKSKRVYQSPSPEVGLKISRSLKVSHTLHSFDLLLTKI